LLIAFTINIREKTYFLQDFMERDCKQTISELENCHGAEFKFHAMSVFGCG